MRPLLSSFVRRQRFSAVEPYMQGDILDLGCGYAEITSLLQPGQAYVGVERRPEVVDRIRRRLPQFTFFNFDLDTDELSLQRSFDTILMVAVVEHLKDPAHVLQQIPLLLKPSGKLVMTTPSPMGGRLHGLGARLGLFYVEALREHETIFSLDTVRPVLERSGLRIVEYRKFLLGGNQLLICQAAENSEREKLSSSIGGRQ